MKTINEQLSEQIRQGQEKPLNRPKSQSRYVESMTINNNAEKTLSFISEIFLIVGLGISIILIITGLYKYSKWDNEYDLYLLIIGLIIACVAIVNWAVFRVLCNISNYLKGIYWKIDE